MFNPLTGCLFYLLGVFFALLKSVKEQNLNDPSLYINRELSLLQFNYRVLEQANESSIPLLERLRFLFICSSNLDEFFEVRVAGLKETSKIGLNKLGPDQLDPEDVLKKISVMTHQLVSEQYETFNKKLIPSLEKENIRFLPETKWSSELAAWIKRYFRNEILPILSPVALDSAHPFPRLVNKSLNFLVSLEGKDAFGRDCSLAIVHAPQALPRVIRVPDELSNKGQSFVFLATIIKAHATDLFQGMQVTGCYQFRLTRNSDLDVDEDVTEDLAHALKSELLSRRYRSAVRLEIASDCPEEISMFLLQKHKLNNDDLYHCDGPVNLCRYIAITDLIDRPDLCYPKFKPTLPKRLDDTRNIFDILRDGDILLHHPYQTFSPVIGFVNQATHDPNVLAIKQTLYRTSSNSLMVQALIEAARAGKEVTAVIELRARFEEESNIELANRLQEAGALVVYGVVGFKTHAKLTLIVRREGDKLQRYAHLSTGNYNEKTATQYTDLGLITYNPALTSDVQKVFQQLTGMGKVIKLKKLFHAPFTLFKSLANLIENEIHAAKQGRTARIIAKVNGLTDPEIIKTLYKASQSGVKIDLIIRGICSLRPGIKGISENITVRSVIGRFLEHERVYYFYNGGDEKVYCSSADWLQRNLYYRVEVCFPIEDKKFVKRIKDESLMNCLSENCHSWKLDKEGNYIRPESKHCHSPQDLLLEQFKIPLAKFS